MYKFLTVLVGIVLILTCVVLLVSADNIKVDNSTLPSTARFVRNADEINSSGGDWKMTPSPEIFIQEANRWSYLATYTFQVGSTHFQAQAIFLTPENVLPSTKFADMLPDTNGYITSDNIYKIELFIRVGNSVIGTAYVPLKLNNIEFENAVLMLVKEVQGDLTLFSGGALFTSFSYDFDFSSVLAPVTSGFEYLSKVKPSTEYTDIFDAFKGIFVEYPSWLFAHVQVLVNSFGGVLV